MKKSLYYLFLLFLIPFCSTAKSNPVLLQAQADFKKANETYEKQESYSMDTYYTVYSEHGTQDRLEAKNGKYIKYKTSSFSQIDDIQVYTFSDKIISINKSDKLITVGDNKTQEFNTGIASADSLLTYCSDIKVESINANEKKYTLYFAESDMSEYSKVEICINTKEKRYTKMVLYYSMAINLKADFYAPEKQPKLEIVYKNFKPLMADPQIFNEALYLINDKETLKPAPKYYNYRVTDLRNKTRIKKTK